MVGRAASLAGFFGPGGQPWRILRYAKDRIMTPATMFAVMTEGDPMAMPYETKRTMETAMVKSALRLRSPVDRVRQLCRTCG